MSAINIIPKDMILVLFRIFCIYPLGKFMFQTRTAFTHVFGYLYIALWLICSLKLESLGDVCTDLSSLYEVGITDSGQPGRFPLLCPCYKI